MVKLWQLLIMLFICIGMSYGLTPCSETSTSTSTAFTAVAYNVDQSITFGGDSKFNSLTTIKPTTQFVLNQFCQNFTTASCQFSRSTAFTAVPYSNNQSIIFSATEKFNSLTSIKPTTQFVLNQFCQNFTAVNSSTSTVYWPSTDTGTGIVYNATSGVDILSTSNYTIDYATGIVSWRFDDNLIWNNTLVSVCYNKTFTTSTDLVAIGLGYSVGPTGDFGAVKTWNITKNEIAARDWTTTYSYVTTTCSGSTSTVYWPSTDTGTGIVYNATGTNAMPTSNYTINYTTGIVSWHFIDNYAWNNTLVSVCYNKTFTTSTDLVTLGLGYSAGTTGDFGVAKTWKITKNEIGARDWTTAYTYTARTCSARDSCASTKTTIFAGLGLLAVCIIVVCAFAIVKIAQGDPMVSLSIVAIGGITLAITLMVGYVVLSNVSATICMSAIG